MIVIPAIDIIGGRCVRLTQGDYSACKVYGDDPVEIARGYAAAGFTRLHVVDLDGAKAGATVNLGVLERICAATPLEVDFSGGLKSDDDLLRVFDAGAAWACIGSTAVTDPTRVLEWLERFGGERIIIGADVKAGKVCIHGWKTTTDTDILTLARTYAPHLKYLMCTDIACDGMLQGPSVALYRRLMESLPGIHLIASGGVSCLRDLDRLNEMGIPSVIVGKALYEGRISPQQLIRYQTQPDGANTNC